MIRSVKNEDAAQICRIYNYYITHTVITFEEIPLASCEMEKRIKDVTSSFPWIVYEEDELIRGYAYANKFKERSAYRYSAELTIYLEKDSIGKGLGIKLYSALLEEIKTQKVHAVIAGLALPNNKSQKLHEKLGFKKVAHFEEVGFKFGAWIDVGYWELILN